MKVSEPARAELGESNDSTRSKRLRAALLVVIALLVVQRLVYHFAYLTHDPFALVTLSDGQLYEEAARDILAHPPFGTQPLYLQGLYAYVLALGMAWSSGPIGGLLVQLALSLALLFLFARALFARFGAVTGALSVIVLLAYPSVAFYENKYLSVALGVACNMGVLAAFVWLLRRVTLGPALVLGLASGLSILGRPNLVLALPFTAFALWRVVSAREPTTKRVPLMAACAAGIVLALAPMAVRNLAVIGRADVLPSHGGGIPFYIGNNPHANGRWNDAGGLVSGQVAREREELAEKLGVHAPASELDAAIGRELYARAFAYMRQQPGAWLALEATKLWDTLGNHAFIRDYDLFGERELLGAAMPIGLPFGVLLALGVLGLVVLYRRDAPGDRALVLVLVGQLSAVLAANLLWFTSAQNRVPLAVPLAFAAGPALVALAKRAGTNVAASLEPTIGAASSGVLVLALVLGAQAFWPRLGTYRPSSVHYFNLASVEEALGRFDAALAHFRLAAQRNPKQPMFALRYAHRAHLAQRTGEARAEFERLLRMPDLPPVIRNAATRELAQLPPP